MFSWNIFCRKYGFHGATQIKGKHQDPDTNIASEMDIVYKHDFDISMILS